MVNIENNSIIRIQLSEIELVLQKGKNDTNKRDSIEEETGMSSEILVCFIVEDITYEVEN